MTNEHALPDVEDVQSDATESLLGLREIVDPLVDMVVGHRQQFLDADFTEDGAESAALVLHEALIYKVLGVDRPSE